MSRALRVKDAIASTLAKVREEIRQATNQGYRVPNLMVGFHNGLALADHHLNMRAGDALMMSGYDEKVTTPAKTDDEQEYEFLIDKVVTAARGCIERCDEIGGLTQALKDLDSFIEQKTAGQGEVAASPDAGSESQVGSSPAPAANQEEAHG